MFCKDYTVDALPGREFGSVFLGPENVAVAVVSAGWAKVLHERFYFTFHLFSRIEY